MNVYFVCLNRKSILKVNTFPKIHHYGEQLKLVYNVLCKHSTECLFGMTSVLLHDSANFIELDGMSDDCQYTFQSTSGLPAMNTRGSLVCSSVDHNQPPGSNLSHFCHNPLPKLVFTKLALPCGSCMWLLMRMAICRMW